MKYCIIAFLIVFTASCAPGVREMPAPTTPPAEETGLEKRFKSENAVEKVRIGQTGAYFFYDGKMWSLKKESNSAITFNIRRFTNAGIFIYNEFMPMEDIYKKLALHYDMKNPKIMESKLVSVNNAVVIFNEIEGVINRRDVSILSYGVSESGHAIIAHCFIYKSMLRSETRQEIIDFLNGLAAKG